MNFLKFLIVSAMFAVLIFLLLFVYDSSATSYIDIKYKKNSDTTKPKIDKEPLNLVIKNGNLNGVDGFSGVKYHKYIPNISHKNDGSGSIELVKHWHNKALVSPKFKLEKGKYYTFGAYIKAIGANRGQNIMFKISGDGYFNEMNWNVSKAGVWENVVFPYRVAKSGYYQISVFTYKYSLTTDKKYAKRDGSNLDRSAKIYVDDFYIYEGDSITKEPISKKVPFKSSIVKIDSLGNWSIKEGGKWKSIFPKFVYQDWSSNFAKSAKMYSSYGFSGFVNLNSLDKIKIAIKSGLKYNGIQINNLNSETKGLINSVNKEISLGKLPKSAIINYEFDNENEALCNYDEKRDTANWLSKADGGKRLRPINMLNGVSEGVARSYKNRSGKNYIDSVSTYMAELEHNFKKDYNQSYNPVNTLGILQNTQNQIAPVSIMQLQCYYGKKMIPYIFKGIGAGAKGLNFWRAGDGVPDVCPTNFEDNYFAPVLKDIFTKLDKMLPIIKEPLNTPWNAVVDKPNLVALGTRDYNNKHYIILANFADRDLNIKITLKGLNAKSVKDYFSKKEIAKVGKDNKFTVNIGHNNSGYLVLEIK